MLLKLVAQKVLFGAFFTLKGVHFSHGYFYAIITASFLHNPSKRVVQKMRTPKTGFIRALKKSDLQM